MCILFTVQRNFGDLCQVQVQMLTVWQGTKGVNSALPELTCRWGETSHQPWSKQDDFRSEKFQTEEPENIKSLGLKQIWLGRARKPGGLWEVRLAGGEGLLMWDLGLCSKSDEKPLVGADFVQVGVFRR